MFTAAHMTRPEMVNCEVCFKQLFRFDAQRVKARVYVAHVCGPACYDAWEEEEMRERTREAGEP